jgi:hypothetical protein
MDRQEGFMKCIFFHLIQLPTTTPDLPQTPRLIMGLGLVSLLLYKAFVYITAVTAPFLHIADLLYSSSSTTAKVHILANAAVGTLAYHLMRVIILV